MIPGEPSLKQFRYLVAVADHKHFRRAAEACAVSQPSLSVQIQNLEEVLGVRLVERGRGGAIFTPIGREVVARARRILLETQSVVDFVTSAEHRAAGTIRLGVKATLGPYLLPKIVAALSQEMPETKLYIREGVPTRLEEELANGMHDVVLAQLPIHHSDFVTQTLFNEPIMLAVSKKHPLARHQKIKAQDLKGLAILSLTPEYHLHDQVHALCKDFGARVIRDYEGNSLDTLRQMTAMDMGATFLPALYVQSELANSDDVVALPMQGRRVFRSIGLVWRKGAGRATAYKHLAEFIRETARKQYSGLVFE